MFDFLTALEAAEVAARDWHEVENDENSLALDVRHAAREMATAIEVLVEEWRQR